MTANSMAAPQVPRLSVFQKSLEFVGWTGDLLGHKKGVALSPDMNVLWKDGLQRQDREIKDDIQILYSDTNSNDIL